MARPKQKWYGNDPDEEVVDVPDQGTDNENEEEEDDDDDKSTDG